MSRYPRVFAMALAFAAAASTPVAAEVIGQMTPAEPLTEARINILPADQRGPWLAYLRRSQALLAADKAALAMERRQTRTVVDRSPEHGKPDSMALDRPDDWYRGATARRIAANILSYQTPAGGWGKNQERDAPPRAPGQSYVPIENLPAYAETDIQADRKWRYVGTIDNDATLHEMRFLARMQAAMPGPGGEPYRKAFLKGFRYLFAAQFPNGGWPQVYPLQGGYHDAVTYNDSAMSQAALLMNEIGSGTGAYAFAGRDVAEQARRSARRATALILRTQAVIDGRPTIWGQQHDALTLRPVGARNFEPAALSTAESVDLIRFLKRQPDQSDRVRAAIASATQWLREHALSDVEWKKFDDAAGPRLVASPGAPPLWARFYDLQTQRPIFGDRDRMIRDDANEVSLERRKGYSWFNRSPRALLIP